MPTKPTLSTFLVSCRRNLNLDSPTQINLSINLSDLRNLPVSEKLRIVEALWDYIGAADEPILIQPCQREKTQGRIAELPADSSIAIDHDSIGNQTNLLQLCWRHTNVACWGRLICGGSRNEPSLTSAGAIFSFS